MTKANVRIGAVLAALALACSGKSPTSPSGGSQVSNGSGGSAGADASNGSVKGEFFCGVESCATGRRCCPTTGLCYDPADSTSCALVGCTAPDGQKPDSSCCPDGLELCEATSTCHHAKCEGCCEEPVACNQHSECPTDYSCCYATRQCYHPALGDCPDVPPHCAADGSCPGDLVCCEEHEVCYEPDCKDCCSAECAPETAHCGSSMPCCEGLECCSGVPVPPGQEYCGAICPISDRDLKHQIEPADADAVLERLARLPISVWSYDWETDQRHIGPMSQDFKQAFDLGGTEQCIPTVDANGVALAAVQALYHRVERLSRETEELKKENAALRRELTRR